MRRSAVILHTLPGGDSHFDWLIDVNGSSERVPTFRCRERPDDPRVAAFAAERIADHRREYFTYEGPVGGDRGHVRPVGSGTVRSAELTNDRVRVEVEFDGRLFEWRAVRDGEAAWHFFRSTPAPP